MSFKSLRKERNRFGMLEGFHSLTSATNEIINKLIIKHTDSCWASTLCIPVQLFCILYGKIGNGAADFSMQLSWFLA